MSPSPTRLLARGFLVSVVLLAPQALAQDAQDLFHQAYYLENEGGDLGKALKLYKEVSSHRRADGELRARAEHRARGLAEELVAGDLARLVPSDAILFAELDQPGDQLGMLLDQLGLLGESGRVDPERISISPLLIDHALGMQGAAVAVTEIGATGQPNGVVILNPGRHEGLRGLIDTLLPAGGTQVDSIGGYPAWSVEGQATVCLTSRLVVASPDPRQVAGVVARLRGEVVDSLADDPDYASTAAAGGASLVRFFVNADPLKPLIRQAIAQEAGNDPGVAMAMNFLDLDSLRSLSGRLGVDEEGLGLDLALDLDEGHRNLVFNLMRRPTVGRKTLELVPEGAAFFLATAFNYEGGVAPIARDGSEQPVVSLLDFGREMFGNVVDVAVYGMPSGASHGLPDAALVVRVNDVERSRALWELALGTASQAAGGGEPGHERIGGGEVTSYEMHGVPVYLASTDSRLIVSANAGTIERAMKSRRGSSAAQDPVFASSLGVLDESPTMILAACPGRMAEMGMAWAPERDARQMEPFVDLLGETCISVAAQHSDTRMALGVRVHHVPNVSGMVTQLVAARRDAAGQAVHAVQESYGSIQGITREAAAKPAPAGDAKATQARFEELVARGDRAAATRVAEQMAATGKDPKALNNLAWALLTEDRFGREYDGVARVLSLRSNELSEHGNWYYLDTLALAEFRAGHVKKAIKLQEKVLELAAKDGEQPPELMKSLERYRAALEKRSGPIVQRESGAIR